MSFFKELLPKLSHLKAKEDNEKLTKLAMCMYIYIHILICEEIKLNKKKSRYQKIISKK